MKSETKFNLMETTKFPPTIRLTTNKPSRIIRLANFGAIMILSGLVLALCGCSDGRPTRVKVSGTVTIDGEPLKGGSIMFHSATARSGGGAIEDGKYKVTTYTLDDGLPPGSYQVSIYAAIDIDDDIEQWYGPKKYSTPEESGLVAEIKDETDSMNFELTWEGDKLGKPFKSKR